MLVCKSCEIAKLCWFPGIQEITWTTNYTVCKGDVIRFSLNRLDLLFCYFFMNRVHSYIWLNILLWICKHEMMLNHRLYIYPNLKNELQTCLPCVALFILYLFVSISVSVWPRGSHEAPVRPPLHRADKNRPDARVQLCFYTSSWSSSHVEPYSGMFLFVCSVYLQCYASCKNRLHS